MRILMALGGVLGALLYLSTTTAGATDALGHPGAPVGAATVPLVNGGFDDGDVGWTLGGVNGGIARVEVAGSCFGANNTQGIGLKGGRALNVRSSPSAPRDSVGSAVSSPFTFSDMLSFVAMAENDDAVPAPDPVTLEVVILAEAGQPLAVHAVKPWVMTTSPGTSNDGCLVGELRSGGRWSVHAIDTSAYAGQVGRVEFRAHTNVPGKGFFALVDRVSTTCETPGAPRLLQVDHSGGRHILTWTAPTVGPPTMWYNVYGDSSNPPTTLLNTGGHVLGTTFTHGSGGHRWYRVGAVNHCGMGPLSNVIFG